MSHTHDTGYKELFSHPEFVEALLDGFIPPQITRLLDYSTLTRHSGNYITPLFQEKIEDAVWSLTFKPEHSEEPGQRLYLYLLLEFQSGVDASMALRMLHYSAGFYQHLLKERLFTLRQGLPLVFPVVLYNGERNWTPACNMLGLLQPAPAFLQPYQPSQSYYLLDVKDFQNPDTPAADNLLQLVFNVENARTAEAMQKVSQQLADGIRSHPERARIDRVLTRWFKRFLYQNHITIDYTAVNELQEIPPMLANRVESWFEEWKQQGLKEGRELGLETGREEGREEGLEKGKLLALRQNLARQVSLKFGSLPDACARRLEQAEYPELELWAERILFVDNLDALFA